MVVIPIKTHKITSSDTDIFKILDKYISDLKEKSVLAITSKIIAICQGRLVKIGTADKDTLIEQESQWYLPREENPYKVSLTIANSTLVATAGIDESNAGDYYILWPDNPQKIANEIRKYLREKYHIKKLGIIITDSKTSPLRWGVTAFAIAYSGVVPLKDYVGEKDLFGRTFAFEKMSIIDNLSSSVSVVMGEGSEQTPMAIIEDIPFVTFCEEDPSEKELKSLQISPEEDLYAPLLRNAGWRKGKKLNY